MSLQALAILVVVGGIAGWLAAVVMKGRGLGLFGNIVVGIVGAFVGNFVLGLLHVSIGGGLLASILNAFIGALILLFLIGVLRRR